MIDLGAWFSEERGIPGEEAESDETTDRSTEIESSDAS
jgi:endogenous inhibitor of DNA gyrase (YacG/DUF329 family)